MSLYSLASTTYILSSNDEQANDNKKEYFYDKNCVFVSESMHKIDDVIFSSSIAGEEDIIPIIELLSGKLSLQIQFYTLQKDPFNCIEQQLEQIYLSLDKVINKRTGKTVSQGLLPQK